VLDGDEGSIRTTAYDGGRLYDGRKKDPPIMSELLPPTKTPPALTVLLEPVLGPPTATIRLGKSGQATLTLGRLPTCEIQTPENETTISRRHCIFETTEDGKSWTITDLGSRHGSFVNNVALVANQPHKLRDGEMLRIGPWTYRVLTEGGTTFRTLDDTGTGQTRVVSLAPVSQESIDRTRLQVLLRSAKLVHSAEDEFRLAAAVLDPLLEGTGFPRAAVLRSAAKSTALFEQIEVLATKAASGGRPTTQFSRSLLMGASKGQMVQLKPDDQIPSAAMSILSSGTSTAVAVPIMLDGVAAMYLYLDARREERAPPDGAAAFCQAIAEMCSLALSGILRGRLEAERARYTEQMEAGMAIQRQILPPPSGKIFGVKYALDLRPGRFVAGDLFDIFAIDNRRVAFFIGDVAGKGLPAAILMATTQSFLNAVLCQLGDPAKAADAVNKHLIAHCPENKFVSLWMGVLDVVTGLLQYVDCGHGYWLLREPRCEPVRVREGHGGGAPLRVMDGVPYRSDELQLAPGTRIVLFSDGVVEQANPDGVAFGDDRVSTSIMAATTVGEDVESLVRAVRVHAGTDTMADDLTVASIEFAVMG